LSENKENIIGKFENLLERLITIQLKNEIKRKFNTILENINKDLAEICSVYKNKGYSLTKEELQNLMKKLEKNQIELKRLVIKKNE